MSFPATSTPPTPPDTTARTDLLCLLPGGAAQDSANAATTDTLTAEPLHALTEAQDDAPINPADTYLPGIDSIAARAHIFPGFIGKNGPSAHAALPGFDGEPLPYRLRTDNGVAAGLLLSLLLLCCVIARSRRLITRQTKDFFRERSQSSAPAPDEGRLRGAGLILLLDSIVLAVLTATLAPTYLPFATQLAPPMFLLVATSLFFLFLYFKIGLYRFVNNVFFEREAAVQWNATCVLLALILGLCLLPVALLVTYADLPPRQAARIALGVALLLECLLLYKAIRLFSHRKFGIFHAFLYFCTLEGLPLVLLWQTVAFTLAYLQTTD